MMTNTEVGKVGILSWTLLIVLVALSLLAWGQALSWNFSGIGIPEIFPLLGIIAWLTMWTHYSLGSYRLLSGMPRNKRYNNISGVIVLFAILLHPGLLAWYQWQRIESLPPQSFYQYVSDSLAFFVLLGSISLLIFLSFEIFDRLKDRKWVQKNWLIISLTQMAAMVAIFVHALRLGSILDDVLWFKILWIVLGASLIIWFGLLGREDYIKQREHKNKQKGTES